MKVGSPLLRDLGGFSVRRILPTVECRSLGPFVFFDEMGPLVLKTGLELEVRPHPHIGLATMTWLFQGAMMHRDSLGSVQVIHPGAVNLMTAGRGIVHSERVSQSGMRAGAPGNDTIHGAQFWLALPKSHEDCDPAFAHHPAGTIPRFVADGVQGRVVMGAHATAAGVFRSPVVFPTASAPHPTLCLDIYMEAGARFTLPADPACPERGVYPVAGAVTVNGTALPAHTLGVPEVCEPLVLEASAEGAHLLVIGGAPLDGPRHLDWNFVASDRARLEKAKADWREGRFPTVPGETEFIPLP